MEHFDQIKYDSDDGIIILYIAIRVLFQALKIAVSVYYRCALNDVDLGSIFDHY